MSKLITKKRAVVAGVAIAAIGAGTAYAYWTTTGSGTGSASTGTSHAVSVTQVGTISNLTPGSTPQAVDFKIHNGDSTNQYVASVAVSIASIDPNPAGGSCTTSDFALVQPSAINQDLVPGDTTFSPSGATLQLIDRADTNQDGCKNATVHLAFNAS